MNTETRARGLRRRGPERVSVDHLPAFTENQARGFVDMERMLESMIGTQTVTESDHESVCPGTILISITSQVAKAWGMSISKIALEYDLLHALFHSLSWEFVCMTCLMFHCSTGPLRFTDLLH